MNIITSIAPIAAAAASLASSPTLILAIGLLHLAAKAVSRLIPDDKTGVLGTIRKAAKVVGVEPENRVADVTPIAGIAKSILKVDANGFVKGWEIKDGVALLQNVAIKTLKVDASSGSGSTAPAGVFSVDTKPIA